MIKEEDGLEFDEHIYNENHTKQVIQTYQSVLRNIVENCSDEKLICVLLEKPIYRITKNETTYAKNGFHLHFPYLFLSKVDQEVHLIPRVQDSLKELEVFSDLGI